MTTKKKLDVNKNVTKETLLIISKKYREYLSKGKKAEN